MQLYQRTIQNAVSISGQGLHTGKKTTVNFTPAPAGSGISFLRKDLGKHIPALAKHITETNRGTSLEYDGAEVRTTEHVLAAIASLGIDNVVVEVSGAEIPILDGSAAPFVSSLEKAGIQEQAVRRRYFKPSKPIHFHLEDTDSDFTLEPADDFQIHVEVDYDTEVLGVSTAEMNGFSKFIGNP